MEFLFALMVNFHLMFNPAYYSHDYEPIAESNKHTIWAPGGYNYDMILHKDGSIIVQIGYIGDCILQARIW